MSIQVSVVTIPNDGMYDGAALMEKLYEELSKTASPAKVACGGTGYLDGKVEMDGSVGVGVDEADRPFICVRWLRETKAGRRSTGTITFFRRYSQEGSVWTMAINDGYSVEIVRAAIDPDEARRIAELVHNGSVNVPSERYTEEGIIPIVKTYKLQS